jgi:hypothetical protein
MKHHSRIYSVRREDIDLTKLAHAALRLARELDAKPTGSDVSEPESKPVSLPRPRRPRSGVRS